MLTNLPEKGMKNKNDLMLHVPVLKDEVLEAFAPLHLKETIIDATVGYGGHSKELIQKGYKILGIDADHDALAYANEVLEYACPEPDSFPAPFQLLYGNFKDIDTLAREAGIAQVHGILFDLGVSSPELTSSTRGFSFQYPDAPLDMRMDTSLGVTAADLLNALPARHLQDLFCVVMNRKEAVDLARRAVQARQSHPFKTVGDLLILLPSKIPGKTHPATKPFMALRMAVNAELEVLQEALTKSIQLLMPKGRLVVITFHSGEDQIVKNFLNSQEENGVVITKKPIIPSEEELTRNPRARSAKLRIFEKR